MITLIMIISKYIISDVALPIDRERNKNNNIFSKKEMKMM
jgi:hypothetical protein